MYDGDNVIISLLGHIKAAVKLWLCQQLHTLTKICSVASVCWIVQQCKIIITVHHQ